MFNNNHLFPFTFCSPLHSKLLLYITFIAPLSSTKIFITRCKEIYHLCFILQKAEEAEAGSSDKGRSRLSRCLSAITSTINNQVTLVRTPVMRRRSLIAFFLWFVAASVYYGLIFSGSNIKADPFLMIFSSGIVELPSAFVFIFPLDK